MSGAYRWTICAVFAAALMGMAGTARAEVRISGFGQVVVGQQSGDGAYPFVGYPDDDLDFRQESLFAVQVSSDINDKFSATAQVLARGGDDFDAELAWAYLAWQATDNINVKFGRQRLPFFTYSDYIDVGYAYMWVRPPVSVYNILFSNVDGVSATWSGGSGAWEHLGQLVLGRFDGDLGVNQGQIQGIVFGSFTSTYDGWLSLRAAYGFGDLSIQISALDPLFQTLDGAGLGALRSTLDIDDDKAEFTGLAAQADRGKWLAGVEFTRVEIDDFYGATVDNSLAYVAMRFGNVQPFISYGERHADAQAELLATVPVFLPAPLRGAIAGLVLGEDRDESFASVGLRWDFKRNVAFKFEYSQYDSKRVFRPDSDLTAAAVVFTF